MYVNLPFEIQVEIIKRVAPVRSLVRFRSVSKQWKSLIDSSEFINHHIVNQTQPDHLLVKYKLDSEIKFISVVDDDDSFPDDKFFPTVPPTMRLLSNLKVLGSSYGLVCLYCFSGEGEDRKNMIIIWNPSIRKYVNVLLPDGIHAFGFGVCTKTFDPKIVKITDGKAEVFTLSTGAWKNISIDLSSALKLIKDLPKQEVTDGFFYWADHDIIRADYDDDDIDDYEWVGDLYFHRIVSFDFTREEFGELHLPEDFQHGDISIFKLEDSLAVVNYEDVSRLECYVWMMMKNGDAQSLFEKLYHVMLSAPDAKAFYSIVGFRKNGEIIREHRRMKDLGTTYEVYEPYTKEWDGFDIEETGDSRFKTTSYTESLLLLNHFDSTLQ